MSRPVVAVIGGGITGLTAAYLLHAGLGADEPAPGVRVTLLEAASRLGGKLHRVEVGAVEVDAGADAFVRRGGDEAVDALLGRLGLAADVEVAAARRPQVWVRGRLRPLPAGTVLGVPAALGPLARSGILSPAGLLRAAAEPLRPQSRLDTDRSVGALVRERYGREVVERLVDPLLGGIYAGRADDLSVEATMPRVAAVARRHRSLLLGLRAEAGGAGVRRDSPGGMGSLRGDPAGGAARPGPPRGRPGDDTAGAPVLASLQGGLGRLAAALADALEGADVRVGSPVRSLRPRPDGGWRVGLGGGHLDADGVVLAVPAPAAAALLAEAAPAAAAALRGISYASVAVALLAYPGDALPGGPPGSGMLVPAASGWLCKAATWLSAKWPSLAREPLLLVRCSVGRSDDGRFADLEDSALVRRLHAELRRCLPLRARPQDAVVVRWPQALPQYAVGHLERVRRARAALPGVPPLVLAGAACDGVGVAACVRGAGEQVRRLLAVQGRVVR